MGARAFRIERRQTRVFEPGVLLFILMFGIYGCVQGTVMKSTVAFLLLLVCSVSLWARRDKPDQCPSFVKHFELHDAYSRGMADWYGRQLFYLHEQCLPPPTPDPRSRIYRFLWVRAFDPAVSVRLEIAADGSGRVFLKSAKYSNRRSHYRDRIIQNTEGSVSAGEVHEFLTLLQSSGFWEQTWPEHSGKDGARWVLEAYESGRYHMQDVWSPREGKYRETCLLLLKMSKLELNEEQVY